MFRQKRVAPGVRQEAASKVEEITSGNSPIIAPKSQ